MNGFLLDTNVVSELTKNVPNSQVIAFLAAQNDLWLSIIVLHELDFGLNLLPLGRRRDRISAALAAFVTEYEDRILPVDRPEAEQAASLRAQARRSGRVLHLGDALIAGTAKTHNLAVATRNVADFDGLDVDVTNPWEAT
ncbi:MAG: type II toxin-antitoxin system VapC family toxin [Candidatus Poribacteria bacterium]|nr:type II toxin-antitoxin system VapC family toxin [Candidatus Poribacteria bacterium]